MVIGIAMIFVGFLFLAVTHVALGKRRRKKWIMDRAGGGFFYLEEFNTQRTRRMRILRIALEVVCYITIFGGLKLIFHTRL